MTARAYYAEILVHEVIDGDTIRATIDLGWRVRVDVTIRLDGIDTPETRHANPLHKRAGELVRDYVRKTLSLEGSVLRLRSNRLDLYGRSLGDVTIDGTSLIHLLMSIDLAKETGPSGKRIGWSDEELQAIVARLET